jgi:hypothetical protein
VWLASCLSPTSVDLVGARLLLAKQPLEEFRCLRRLWLSSVKSPAGCWRSRPFKWIRPFWLNIVEIPGTLVDRWLCPWPTLVVIPMTLAPKTGEVSWVSMGLRRVLFLAEVYSHLLKSQDPSSGSEIVAPMAKFRGVLPAVSGRAGSRIDPASGCSAAASRHLAPRNLNRFEP